MKNFNIIIDGHEIKIKSDVFTFSDRIIPASQETPIKPVYHYSSDTGKAKIHNSNVLQRLFKKMNEK